MTNQIKGTVFMFPKEVVCENQSKLLRLRNPATKEASYFLINQKDGQFYEVEDFDEKYRSWFINKTVYSDGSIKIVTVYNPVFLILPYLMQAEKNLPLEQLLEDKEYPSVTRLADIVEDLSCVADRKGPADLNVWKYNESSSLNWLTSKVEKLAVHLQESHEKPSLTCSVTTDKELYRVLAFGIISENISKELAAILKVHLKLPESTLETETNQEHNKENKRVKIEDNGLSDAPSQTKKVPVVKQTSKEKTLAKSAKGTKSITSFFTKKNKN